jgi:hypothetical protein
LSGSGYRFPDVQQGIPAWELVKQRCLGKNEIARRFDQGKQLRIRINDQFPRKELCLDTTRKRRQIEELLVGEYPLPAGFKEEPLTHVQAYTFGHDREVSLVPHLSSPIGAQVTTDGVGQPLQTIYGPDPVGLSVFIRLRPGSHTK